MKKLTATIAAQAAIKGAAARKFIPTYATTAYRYSMKTGKGSTYAVNKPVHSYEVRIETKHTYGKDLKKFTRVIIRPIETSRHKDLTKAVRRERAMLLRSAMVALGYNVSVVMWSRWNDTDKESVVAGTWSRVRGY